MPPSRPVRRLDLRLSLPLVVLLVALVGLLVQPARPAAAAPADELYALTNGERARAGSAPLTPSPDLTAVAQAWSQQMAGDGRLRHNPTMSQQVCCWRAVAENVGYSSSVAGVHRLLMASAGHRRNVLNPGYGEVGMGAASDRQGRVWVTQVFRAGTAAPPAIAGHRAALGAGGDFLGAPVAEELPTADGVGRWTLYQGGAVYWHPSARAAEVHGDILGHWWGMGAERSLLGYPLTDELPAPDRFGRFSHFQGGSVYWTPALGAHAVYGAVRDAWAASGWELGPLGYPVSDEYAVPGGRASDFERGRVVWNQASDTAMVTLR